MPFSDLKSPEAIWRLFSALGKDDYLASARELRERCFGSRVELCAIINIRSGDCEMDCAFCAQSRHNAAKPPVYPLLPDEILRRRLEELAKLPLAHIGLVASGGALHGEEFERLSSFIADLPENLRVKVCASLGRLPKSRLNVLREAGLKRYHHNLETCEAFYPSICRSQKWIWRRQTAMSALELGLELCCGGLFGLGENWAQRAALAMQLKEMGIENIPMNFLDPVPGSPMEGREHLACGEALRIIALFRHILPNAVLRVCGGRLKCFGPNQELMFQAGANALMSGDFLTTKGGAFAADMDMLRKLGMNIIEA